MRLLDSALGKAVVYTISEPNRGAFDMGNALYFGDNLEWLRDRDHFPDESVDLIYLDPPFNSKADYNKIFSEPGGLQSRAQIKAFDDTWDWASATSVEAYTQIAESPYGEVTNFVKWVADRRDRDSRSMAAYLSMMGVRLIELKRVLKPTGSIYLHCDPTASHYLKVLMDTVFGARNFRNEIVWQRTFAGKPIYRNLPKNSDVILWFTKSDNYLFVPIRQPLSEEDKRTFNLNDDDGRGPYNTQPIINPADRPNLKYVYHDLNGRKWHPPKTGWRFNQDRMRRLELDDRLVFGKTSIREKYYLLEREKKGKQLPNIWSDIPIVSQEERLGYPTQKPEALLGRIIEASSNEGDVVLDPFSGCGTAVIAAHRLKRQWIGIDVTYLAIDLIEERLKRTFPETSQGAYEIYGRPVDKASAKRLMEHRNKEFEIWAVSLVGAHPRQHDGGVDGVYTLVEGSTERKTSKVIVQVKGGKHLNPSMVRDLLGTLEKENSVIGLLITLEPPTKGMEEVATHSGFYESPVTGLQYPRVQIRTIQELVEEGKKFELPPGRRPW